MRVVLLTEMFCKGMGYLENMLPKYFARMGVETHVVTTDLPPSFRLSDFEQTYADFLRPLATGTVESCNGYTLHVLAHRKVFGRVRMVGLRQRLHAIHPDIVQAMTPIGWIALDAALAKCMAGYKLFTGNHYHASVFPLANNPSRAFAKERFRCLITRTIPGWLISLCSEKCYAITSDCADVATRFFGVPKNKISICPLGVDTELFHPVRSEKDEQARARLRQRLGFSASDIVCVYSGRFSEDKNPLLLAKVVARLAEQQQPFRALFVGNGVQAQAIRSCAGCTIHPFVPVEELGDLFRAADIGVWPTQESMSMLDAAACGLSIVANHTMSAPERIEGNGLTYRLNDMEDLSHALTALRERSTRLALGSCGAKKMANEFSWESVAGRRLKDYWTVLRSGGPLPADTVSRNVETQPTAD